MSNLRSRIIRLAQSNPDLREHVLPLIAESTTAETYIGRDATRTAAWENLPNGWTDESVQSFWDSLTGDVKHKITKCMKRMDGKVTDTGAFCGSLASQVGYRAASADTRDATTLRRAAIRVAHEEPSVREIILAGLTRAASRMVNVPGIHVRDNARVRGDAYVGDDAMVGDSALVTGMARVIGRARVSGNAWVSDDAEVSGQAQVSGFARVYDGAQVYDKAQVSDTAEVYGETMVSGFARVYDGAEVFGDARVSGRAHVFGGAMVRGRARVSGDARIGGDAVILGGSWDGTEGEILSGRWKAPGVPA